jgi:hypothetical protein
MSTPPKTQVERTPPGSVREGELGEDPALAVGCRLGMVNGHFFAAGKALQPPAGRLGDGRDVGARPRQIGLRRLDPGETHEPPVSENERIAVDDFGDRAGLAADGRAARLRGRRIGSLILAEGEARSRDPDQAGDQAGDDVSAGQPEIEDAHWQFPVPPLR